MRTSIQLSQTINLTAAETKWKVLLQIASFSMTSKYCRKNTIIKFSLYRHFGLNLTIEGLCHCFAVEFAFARKATYSRLIVGFNSYDHFVNDTYCNIICYDYFSFLLIQFAYDVFFIEFNLLNCQKINDKNQ